MLLTKSRRIKSDSGGKLVAFPCRITWFCDKCKPGYEPRAHAHSGNLYFIDYGYTVLDEIMRSDDDPALRKVWKPCQHYKKYRQLYTPYRMPFKIVDWGYFHTYACLSGIPCWWLLAANSTFRNVFGNFGDHMNGIQNLHNNTAAPDEDIILKSDDTNQLVENGLAAVLPRVKSELSLINSIIELKDLSSLPRTLGLLWDFTKHLTSRVKRMNKVPRRYSKYRNSFSKDLGITLHEMFRTGSDSYLQLQFGILPLIGDICGLWTVIRRTQKRINDLLNREGKTQMKHFTCHPFIPTGDRIDSGWLGPMSFTDPQFGDRQMLNDGVSSYVFELPQFQLECRRVVFTALREFHLQVEYSYEFSNFQRTNAMLLGFLDALGVNLNPSIIWNALPFTFLVDWVVNLNRWFDSNKVLNLEPRINIHRLLWSETKARVTRLYTKSIPNDAYTIVKAPEHVVMDIVETTYRRDLGIPSDSSLIMSGLNSRELSLAAALVYPKRWRPRWIFR